METTDKNILISNTKCDKCKSGKMKFAGLILNKSDITGMRKFLIFKCNNEVCDHVIQKPYMQQQMSFDDFHNINIG